VKDIVIVLYQGVFSWCDVVTLVDFQSCFNVSREIKRFVHTDVGGVLLSMTTWAIVWLRVMESG